MATVLWQQLGLDINGQAVNDKNGTSVSLNAAGTRMAIGAPLNDNNGSSSGQVRVYDYNGTSWSQVGLPINGQSAGDQFGYSVSLNADGTQVAIGAPSNNSDTGQVRIYEYNGTTWTLVGLPINGGTSGDLSGISVSLSSNGNRVAIGAPSNNGNTGQVCIYDYNGTSWIPAGTPIDGEAGADFSGTSVSLSADGTRVAIGAPRANSPISGQVRIYDFDTQSSPWILVGDIDGLLNDNIGWSVSLSADGTHVATGTESKGYSRIYKFNAINSWSQVGSDIIVEAPAFTQGSSVSLNPDGTRVAIGGPNNGNGQVGVYDYNGTNWVQIAQVIDGEAAGDRNGASVSLSADGNRVAIGAPFNGTGYARVFELTTILPSPICYVKGTLIATSRGMVPIEDLLMSDKLRTYDCIEESMFKPVHGVPVKTLRRVKDTRFKNRFASIKFIGKFTVTIMNEKTAPIRITAGALGDLKPERDLLVSPNHSMLVGDRLVFAKFLVNETTIYQDMSFKKIEYFHVLSDDHYVINANGALSETLGSEELSIFESLHSFPEYIESPLETNTKYKFKSVHIKEEEVDMIQFVTIPEYSFTEMSF